METTPHKAQSPLPRAPPGTSLPTSDQEAVVCVLRATAFVSLCYKSPIPVSYRTRGLAPSLPRNGSRLLSRGPFEGGSTSLSPEEGSVALTLQERPILEEMRGKVGLSVLASVFRPFLVWLVHATCVY